MTRRDSRTAVVERQRAADKAAAAQAKAAARFEPTSAGKAAALRALLRRHASNRRDAQAARLLDALHEVGSLTTHEARELLDVMAPSARVAELRAAGHSIATLWTVQETAAGRRHRFARYAMARS